MTIDLTDVLSEDEITLESLKHELDLMFIESVGFESAHAGMGLLNRFSRFVDKVRNYMQTSLRVTGSKEKTYNIKPLTSALTRRNYSDFSALELPCVEGQTSSYSVAASTLLSCSERAMSITPRLLIPTRDALGGFVNRPSLLNAQLVTSIPKYTPTKESGLVEQLAALVNSKKHHSNLKFKDAFTSLGEITLAGNALNDAATLLQTSERTRKDLSKEVLEQVNTISEYASLLNQSIKEMGSDGPSPEVVISLSKRLYLCAEEVEWFALVRHRRNEFMHAFTEAAEVIYKSL